MSTGIQVERMEGRILSSTLDLPARVIKGFNCGANSHKNCL
jgi:hypothetical protein